MIPKVSDLTNDFNNKDSNSPPVVQRWLKQDEPESCGKSVSLLTENPVYRMLLVGQALWAPRRFKLFCNRSKFWVPAILVIQRRWRQSRIDKASKQLLSANSTTTRISDSESNNIKLSATSNLSSCTSVTVTPFSHLLSLTLDSTHAALRSQLRATAAVWQESSDLLMGSNCSWA